jgi:hypothetical protein
MHSAHDWKELLEPVVVRYRESGLRKYLRADAAFAGPEVYQYLERKGFLYAIRLLGDEVLYRKIDHPLTRPVGRPPKKPIIYYHDFFYQAGSRSRTVRKQAGGRIAGKPSSPGEKTFRSGPWSPGGSAAESRCWMMETQGQERLKCILVHQGVSNVCGKK